MAMSVITSGESSSYGGSGIFPFAVTSRESWRESGDFYYGDVTRLRRGVEDGGDKKGSVGRHLPPPTGVHG